jgi:hypothetical protein
MWAADGTIGLQPEGEIVPNDASFSIQAEYRILSTEREVRTAEDLPWDVVQHGLGLGIGVGF